MKAEDLSVSQRWNILNKFLGHGMITLAPWHGSYVVENHQIHGLDTVDDTKPGIHFQLPNLGEKILESFVFRQHNMRDAPIRRTPFLLRDTENGGDYSIMLDIQRGRLSARAFLDMMETDPNGEKLGLADAYFCEVMHAMRNLIFGKSGYFYGALLPAVTICQANTHNEAWLKSFMADESGEKRLVPQTHGKGLKAILLRAAEIVAHPNYNDAVATCAGNGLHMHTPHNWHLPAVVMALRSYPIPCQAESLLDYKNYAGLLLTYGDAMRNIPGDKTAEYVAEALANLSPTRDTRFKKMVQEIGYEGIHLSILWDILRVEPDKDLPENTMEDSIFRLASGPRPEGLQTNGEALAESIKKLSTVAGTPLLDEILIIDKNHHVIQGLPTADEKRVFVNASKPLRSMTAEEKSKPKFEIKAEFVDADGIYTGPALIDYVGDVIVTVPCIYTDPRGFNIKGNLIMQDGAGGYMPGPRKEKGTVLVIEGPLSAGAISSKSDESLGAKNYTLVCAHTIACDKNAELYSGNLKSTKGGIVAGAIDAGTVVSAAGIQSKGAIYTNTLSTNGKISAKEIHTEWLQGQGEADVDGNITLLYGCMLLGPIKCNQALVLNPRRSANGSYKPCIVAKTIRTQKIEPAGVFLPVDGLENPQNALKGNRTDLREEGRLFV
jgi:hypothetical protein